MQDNENANIVESLLDRVLDFGGRSALNTIVLVLIAAVVLFSSCWFFTLLVPAVGQPEAVETVEVTVIVEETVVVWKTVEVTRLVPVAVTNTPTPLPEEPPDTPTPSQVPSETPTITPTVTYTPTATQNIALTQTRDALGDKAAPKTDGEYIVGTEIAVGLWESAGTGKECYWKREDSAGNTLDSHYGLAGGTINVQSSDAKITFEGCGVFIFVQDAEKILADDARQPKADGFYTVGVEIAPGLWHSDGSGDDCTWARLSETQDWIDSHHGEAGVELHIEPHDYEVLLDGCGTWTFIEE